LPLARADIEVAKEADWNRLLEIEEEQVKAMCERIIEFKPDLVFTEKGVSGASSLSRSLLQALEALQLTQVLASLADLAQHYLVKANITAIRRVRKSDNNRIARATGATIVNRVDDLRESDVGTQCGLFHVEKLGDDYFSFLEECRNPKACTILLRGPSKDILHEVDRNLADAMSVARNVVFDPRLAPGGGATELAVSVGLAKAARAIEGVEGWPYRAVSEAMEVIPRTLIQNCGGNAIRVLTELRVRPSSLSFPLPPSCTPSRANSLPPSPPLAGQARRGRAHVGRRRRDGQGQRPPRGPHGVGGRQDADAQDGHRERVLAPARRRVRPCSSFSSLRPSPPSFLSLPPPSSLSRSRSSLTLPRLDTEYMLTTSLFLARSIVSAKRPQGEGGPGVQQGEVGGEGPEQ